jgi:UDP-N-acetylglucosamine:LPS N-acetylglucosamine transferase
MPFPEFESGRKRILFFSRGRGRSHAVQDMEIARHITGLDCDIQIRFVSYGTGADTLERAGVRHVDLDMPDTNPIHETLILAGKLIGWLQPDLVMSHEEFIVLPAAKIFDKPTMLLTDWFTGPAKPSMTTLPYADRILFLDSAGHFEEPECVRGRVEYVGSVVRELRYSRKDRAKARAELNLPQDSFLVVVLPGSSREEDSPSLELVFDAFKALPLQPKHMMWVAAADYEPVSSRMANESNVIVKDYAPDFDAWIAAADVAITKGTRSTMRELDRLGLPSITLNNIENPIDKIRARTFSNNVALPELATGSDLAALLLKAAAQGGIENQQSGAGARACARSVLRHFQSESDEIT